MDRFEEINRLREQLKAADNENDLAQKDMADKDKEIYRLRRIEDAVLRLTRGIELGADDDFDMSIANLIQIVDANPRPGNDL
ncbi:MAG: hypothetical protein ACR2QF_12180 [Geminicoccaceae bacterium]